MDYPEDCASAHPRGDDPAPLEGRSLIFAEIPDEIAAQIGQIITRCTLLEQKMIDVFRLFSQIESQELAALGYAAIPSAQARLEMLRQSLLQAPAHIGSAETFSRILDEFEAISILRDECAQSVWWTDSLGRLWISRADKSTATLHETKLFDPQTFETCRKRIDALIDEIFAATISGIDALECQG
ncbi:MAG: hypothetical protein KUG65_08710 [Sphingomonadaceae bacterium]|nr:hypothetical protein [Sphingomonadaceae bacterium]